MAELRSKEQRERTEQLNSLRIERYQLEEQRKQGWRIDGIIAHLDQRIKELEEKL